MKIIQLVQRKRVFGALWMPTIKSMACLNYRGCNSTDKTPILPAGYVAVAVSTGPKRD
jgi:hypothetical protein